MSLNDFVDFERFKKMIDEDLNNFEITERFLQLEKSWIACVSHRVFANGQIFEHNDRKKLRNKLMNYLRSKTKSPKLIPT